MASTSGSQASKPVSSRLLNMKFMQKPLSSGPSSATSKNSPSKHSPSSTSPSDTSKSKSSSTANRVSRSAILAAQALESSRREAAINSTAFGAAERWSLSLPASERANEIRGGGEMVGGVKVFMAGNTRWNSEQPHGDSSDDEEEEDVEPAAPVRRYFGGRTAPVLEKKSTEDSEDDISDSGDDTSASESEILRRVESKRAAKVLKKEKDADKTLRNLKQIGGRAQTANAFADMECFGCGEKGHRKSDCPNAGAKGNKGRHSRPGRGSVKREHGAYDGPAIKKQRRY
ncbi:hypothetical protein TWF730_004000 [Orbilia blumenaviensis]|uniref:CCHC-type domain-containing protein n=1 Tax=Orbilia blumenaviensis TaxID=1796055 RepID=A0AAV9U1G9_9PEZI